MTLSGLYADLPDVVTLRGDELMTFDSGGNQPAQIRAQSGVLTVDAPISHASDPPLHIDVAWGAEVLLPRLSPEASFDLTKSGLGTLQLGGDNQSSTAISVQKGVLRLTGPSALGDSLAIINGHDASIELDAEEPIGGMLFLNNAGGIRNRGALLSTGRRNEFTGELHLGDQGATLWVDDFLRLSGSVHGGDLTLQRGLVAVVGGEHTYSGSTTLYGEVFLTEQGALKSTREIVIQRADFRLMNYSDQGVSNDRIGDDIPITMHGGFFIEQGNHTSIRENLGPLTLEPGLARLSLGSPGARLTFSSTSAQPHASWQILPSRELGGDDPSDPRLFITDQAPTEFMGGRVIMLEDHQWHFAQYEEIRGVMPIDASIMNSGDPSSWSPSSHVLMPPEVTLVEDRTIQSVTIRGVSNPDPFRHSTLDLQGHTLNIVSGGLLAGGTTIESGRLTAGGNAAQADLSIFRHTIKIDADIVDNPGPDGAYDPNLGGPLDADNGQVHLVTWGTLELSGTNTYSGQTWINDGHLMFLTPEAVSPNTELILNGGSLLVRDFTISPRKITAKHSSDFGYVRSPGSINSLEVILESGQSNVSFVGEGTITKITPGTFTLQYKVKPDFTGTYVIQEGTLTVAQNSLGEGTTIVEALGQLRPSDSTLRAHIRLDGGDLVNSNLRQLTLESPDNAQAGVIEVVSDSSITIMHPSSLTHLNMPLVLDPGVTLEKRGGGELRVNSDLMLGDGATLALNEGLLWTSARSAIIVGQETSIESTGVLTLSGTLVAAGAQSTLSLDANAVLESSWGLRVPQHTSLLVTQAATPLDVAVGRGQFLAGGGGVNNNLTVADNAIIEPGDVVGTLTIDGNVTIAAARFKFQFHDAAGLPGATNGWDLVDVVENLTFEHERHKRIRMEVTGVDATGQNAGVANFDPTVSRSFALLSAASITGYDTSRFDLTVTGFDNDHPLPNGAEFSLRGVDGEVLLDYNVVFGDFDGDQTLGALDITLLGQEIVSGSTDLSWDVNYDDQLNEEDRSFWVHEIVETYFGDANVDGEFDSSDLVQVFRAGEYEDELAMNSNWATGDWDGDGEFNTTDLVLAFQDGGYEHGPRVEVSAVPEPASFVMLLAGLIGVGVWRRRPWS